MHIFETNANKVSQLDDAQLTSLLNRLLILEAEAAGIPVNSIEVGLNIRAADGGVDASIRWKHGMESTNFFTSRFQVFQCKAESLSPSQCAAELVSEAGVVKPLVAQAFAEGGTYILFTTQLLNAKMKRKRIEAMRNKLTELRTPHATTAEFAVYSAEDIARWANRYLPAIAYVQAVTGFSMMPGLKSWTEWYAAESASWPFRQTSASTLLIQEIRENLSEPRRVIRLNGLPGLGKTRLVLEALGPNGDGPGLAPRAVYFNAGHASTSLPQQVVEWVRHGLSGVLVVDNCLPEVHTMLEKEVRASSSKLSLITIFANPTEDVNVAARIVLKPCAQFELQEAAQEYIAGLPESDAGKIAHLAGGFIFFAYLLCDAYEKGQGIDAVLVDSEVLLRFLGRAAGAPDDDALRTIEACSIFESLHYADGDGPESKSVISISEVNSTQFHKHVRMFIRRGVIEQTGRFIRVRPHPLALRLCRNWWEGVTPQRAMDVFEAVPESMVDALCERLRMLDTLPEARDVAAKLCGDCAPFGQAEVLFSERGARIFRALAEINPESACNSLHAVIFATDVEALREARAARREWVWALTKLIFRSSTYSCAADSLVRLAVAENESYANNATGTLLQTFQVALPGTEVPLSERADKLSSLFASDEPAIIALALQAADKALGSGFFSRTLGAEEQGSGPVLRDYEPSSFEEMCTYWRRVLELIKDAVGAGRCDAGNALPVLAGHLRGFIRANADYLAKVVVDTALEWGSRPWEAGIDALQDALRYDVGENTARIDVLNRWIADMAPAPDDIPGQLSLYVSRPSWSDISEERLDSKVLELAERCAADFDGSRPYLRNLFFGEQRAGFAFGSQLARSMESRDRFLDLVLEVLRPPYDTSVNLGVLCGYACATTELDRAWTNRLVEHLLSDRDLQRYAPEVLSNITPDLATLQRLVLLVKEGLLNPALLERFSYGQALRHLTSSEISDLVLEIGAISDDAAWVALEIGYMGYYGRADEMWPGLRGAIQTLLVSSQLIPKSRRGGRSRDMYAWEQCVLKLLEDADDSVAANIAHQLVKAASARTSYMDLPGKVAQQLLRSHAAAVWPIFSEALLSDDALLAYTMGGFLGRGLRGDATEGDFPLAELDSSVFQQWLQEYPGAPEKAARMVRLVEKTNEGLMWTPHGRLLIDEFGSDVAVLNAVAANLMTGVSWGPRTPFWQSIVTILGEFDNHRLSSVRQWTNRFKASLSANIADERHEEDARSVGRW